MKKIILFLSILFVAPACKDEQSAALNESSAKQYSRAKAQRALSVSQKSEGKIISQNQSSKIERKLIKTGSISFETKDLLATRETMQDALKKYQGYMVRDNQYASNDRISVDISVRVPAKDFDVFLDHISKGVKTFDTKNVQVADVTEQFVDAESRLKTKQALERTYLNILKKARTVREILDVERELSNVRGSIEATQGRLQYLKSQVSLSTLNITFYKKVKAGDTGFFSTVKAAFKEGFTKIKTFIVSVISFWPFIIVLLLITVLIRRKTKK